MYSWLDKTSSRGVGYMAKKKVLVVDDEPHIVNLIKMTLEDKYDVLEAYSGTQAVDLVKKTTPDLVVLDLMMPHVDGFKTCQLLRGLPQTKRTPIMILSAKSQITDKFRSVNAGADDYMVKPFDPQDLLKRIAANLG